MKNKSKISKSFWQALSLGALAGMRTFAAPVVANQLLVNHPSGRLSRSPLRFMQSGGFGIALKIMAAGELVADKLPTTPNRTAIGGVVGRCLSGSLAGATIYKASGHNAVAGALIGFSAALAATYVCYFLRKIIVKQTEVSDPWIGAAEDAIVAGAGLALINC